MLELGLRSAEHVAGVRRRARGARRRRGRAAARRARCCVARDEDEARELERQLAFRESLGLRVERLRAERGARARAGARADAAPGAGGAGRPLGRSARWCSPRCARACESGGVQLREHAPVARVELDGARRRAVTGVALADGERVSAGARGDRRRRWSGQLDGLPAGGARAGAPGQGSDPAPARPRRARACCARVVRFEGGYLVPRADGRYVLGATVEERGFELRADRRRRLRAAARRPRAGARRERAARSRSCRVGLRPGTPDNVPAIGPGALDGPDLGDRPLPQRHPARAADRRAGRRGARRASDARDALLAAATRCASRPRRSRRPATADASRSRR